MGVSENSRFSPQIIHLNRVFHYKPSILEYHYFWKHLHCQVKIWGLSNPLRIVLPFSEADPILKVWWDIVLLKIALVPNKF